jgi:hypothetical protein
MPIPDCVRVTVDVDVPLRPDCSILHVPVTLGGLANAATEVAAMASAPTAAVIRRFMLISLYKNGMQSEQQPVPCQGVAPLVLVCESGD